MMKPRAWRWAATALYLYAATFVLLSLDVVVRVWQWRGGFPAPADAYAVLFFELSRSAVVTAAIVLGVWLVRRRSGQAAFRALAVALGFGAVAFAKLAAFAAFPGALQEQLAEWLRAQQASPALLRFVFGSPAWAGWLALAAALSFAARYPVPATPEAIARSGAGDRAGLLRGAALAGADIGSLFRRLAAELVRRDALAPLRLAGVASAVALLHHLTRSPAVNVAAGVLAAAVGGCVLTLLRAGYHAGTVESRRFLDRLRAGALAAGALFALSALASPWPGRAGLTGVVLLAAAPAPLLVALHSALRRDGGAASS